MTTTPHEKYGHPNSPGITEPIEEAIGKTNDVELNEINTYGHVLSDDEREHKVKRGREATEGPGDAGDDLRADESDDSEKKPERPKEPVKKTTPAKLTGPNASRT